MKKLIFGTLMITLLMTSCVSNKKYADLEAQHNQTKQELTDAKADLQKCLVDKSYLEELNASLKEDKARSLQQVENLTVLTQSSSDNIKEVIAQLSEKDKYINGIRDAMTKKDSINLALAFQLKKDLAAGIQDEDIQIDVEKTVVYISIADKLLFKSGSATVSDRAKEVLGKVATVVNGRPEMEVQVEGYTDNVPINTNCMKDNWDLSVARATSVVRILQGDFAVDPGRLIAAGRSGNTFHWRPMTLQKADRPTEEQELSFFQSWRNSSKFLSKNRNRPKTSSMIDMKGCPMAAFFSAVM